LDVGSAVLALDRRRLFGGRLRALQREANELARIVGITDLIATPYGAAARVIEGCNNLIIHLTYNQPDRLERARQLFDEGTDPPFAQFDLDSRWVAAHLRDIAGDLGTNSVWAHLPPSVPQAAARAMTLGDPPVLSFWPPQLELLSGTPNPLEPARSRGAAAGAVVPHLRGQDLDGPVHRGGARGERRGLGLRRRAHPQPRA